MSATKRILLFFPSQIIVLLLIAAAVEGLSRLLIGAGLIPRQELRMRGPLVVRPHPFLGFVLREGATRGKDTDTPQMINRQGWRGQVVGEKTPDIYRVMCVGDSVVYGDSLAEPDTMPARLAEKLKSLITTKKVEVVNAGVLQYTSAETLAALALRGVDLRPDAVIFYQGANDVAPRLVRPFHADYSHFRNVWIEDPEYRSDRMIEESDGYVTLRWLAGIYPAASRIDYYTIKNLPKSTAPERELAFNRSGNEAFCRNEAAGVAIARSVGARSLIIATASNLSHEDKYSFFSRMIEENRRKQGKTATEQGANFYELPAEFSKNAANFRDNVHFTAAGASAAADSIAAEMQRLGWLPK